MNMNYTNIQKSVGIPTFIFKDCFLGCFIMEGKVEAKVPAVKKLHYMWYGKATKCTKSKLSQLGRDIKRGESNKMRIIIEGYGRMLEWEKSIVKLKEQEIKDVKREAYREQQEEIKRISNIAREDEQFMIDFIQSLDPETVKRANNEYWNKFGKVIGGTGFKSVGNPTQKNVLISTDSDESDEEFEEIPPGFGAIRVKVNTHQ